MLATSKDPHNASEAPSAGGDALLRTKLFVPPLRAIQVGRPRLIEKLNDGLDKALILVSAPAGFGKTTAIAEWVAGCAQPVAWLSLDEGDNDPVGFLIYFVAALQTIDANIGGRILGALQSPQPPAIEWALTDLLNEIAGVAHDFVIVLDDYHSIDSTAVDSALTFLLEHQPAHMHVVIATREDPHLPLAQLRARDRLTEVRAADLRFTATEAAEFLNHVMGLNLSAEDIAALEARTEGWIAGLQLAALSMQGGQDPSAFIRSFSGSHRFILDYLVEEVLGRQPAGVQTFLLRTSIFERMCAPLCAAVLQAEEDDARETLEHLERANLFIVPLDNERHWYRYHHLFAELLRQRLHQSGEDVPELHRRASQWYEDNGLDIEAFRHAAAAHDIERAERLIDARGMPLYSLQVATTVLDWLASLPKDVLDARPSLWVRNATLLLMTGRLTGIEEKLRSAETALQDAVDDDTSRDLMGQIAAIKATLAVVAHYDPEEGSRQSRRALELLQADNRAFRSRATWTLGYAHQLQGDRARARQIFTEAMRQASGNSYHTLLASASLAQIQESENELHQAAESYMRSLQFVGDQAQLSASEENVGLARIFYEWNDLDAAEKHGEMSLQMARRYHRSIDRFIASEVLLARVKLTLGDTAGAAAILAGTAESVHQYNYVHRAPEVAAVQVLALLRQGNIPAAAELAQAHDLPLSRARVHLARGESGAALTVLEPFRRQMEEKCWQDELLKAMVLQAVALSAHGDKDEALHVLGEALGLAEPGGFIRTFLDEGTPMAELLSEAAAQGIMPDYSRRLLAAFEAEQRRNGGGVRPAPSQSLIEPLSERELEILQLIAQGLSNHDISQRLFLALSTVKGHNRVIFAKLNVQNRTEAVARARELGLLQADHPGR